MGTLTAPLPPVCSPGAVSFTSITPFSPVQSQEPSASTLNDASIANALPGAVSSYLDDVAVGGVVGPAAVGLDFDEGVAVDCADGSAVDGHGAVTGAVTCAVRAVLAVVSPAFRRPLREEPELFDAELPLTVALPLTSVVTPVLFAR